MHLTVGKSTGEDGFVDFFLKGRTALPVEWALGTGQAEQSLGVSNIVL